MEKIKTEDLVMEIATAINDLFVAEATREGKEILISFKNGQKFFVSVREDQE